MVPLLAVTGVTIIVAIWTSVALLFLLPVQFLVMKSLTRNEPMRFNLIAVWLRAKGKPVANRLFGATTFMPVEHDDVDIKEFLDAMKLNQCATLSTKVVPSWWTRWKKWLPVRINFPVGCRIVKG